LDNSDSSAYQRPWNES